MTNQVVKKYLHFLIIFISLNSVACATNLSVDSLYNHYEVSLDTGINRIYGTLTLPKIQIQNMPVVLIISGSGPTDRDGNNPYGLATDSYLKLANGLAENGIASLRYDKRGVAKSESALVNEKHLTIGVYVNDGERWIKWLRKDERFSKIIVLGHSEGALIGTLVANFQRANAFISVCGAGTSADTLLVDQIFRQSPALADTAKRIIGQIKKGESFYVNKDLAAIFRPGVVSYLHSWFSLSPVVEIGILRCPVMIIQGNHDIQVSVAEARMLAEAKSGSKLLIVDQMNHVLKSVSESRDENIASYRDKTLPLAKELVPAISDFIGTLP